MILEMERTDITNSEQEKRLRIKSATDAVDTARTVSA